MANDGESIWRFLHSEFTSRGLLGLLTPVLALVAFAIASSFWSPLRWVVLALGAAIALVLLARVTARRVSDRRQDLRWEAEARGRDRGSSEPQIPPGPDDG